MLGIIGPASENDSILFPDAKVSCFGVSSSQSVFSSTLFVLA